MKISRRRNWIPHSVGVVTRVDDYEEYYSWYFMGKPHRINGIESYFKITNTIYIRKGNYCLYRKLIGINTGGLVI